MITAALKGEWAAEFFAEVKSDNVIFNAWEYHGTYANPVGGVCLDWLYRSPDGKEFGYSLDADYSKMGANGEEFLKAGARVLGKQCALSLSEIWKVPS